VKAEFFPNSTFEGNSVSNSYDNIRFNWGYNAPVSGVPDNKFSARFTKDFSVDGNTDYFVHTFADDRIQVDVDNKAVISRWRNSAGQFDQGIVTGLSQGNHTFVTKYYEDGGKASVFSEILPFGKWLAYYYPNRDLSGHPVNSKVIEPTGQGSLYENNRFNSPASGIPKDNFSAKYVTAKKIPAGEYIVKARADDGVRVYIDGKLVLDRWTGSTYREDAIKINIADHPETGDTHWVEVRYFDKTNESRLYVAIEKFNLDNQLNSDGWYAEYYPTTNLTGTPYVMGGPNTINTVNKVNFNWKTGSPSSKIPVNNFSASLQKKVRGSTDYFVQTFADDGVSVTFDGKKVIDRWSNSAGSLNRALIEGVSTNDHIVKTEYYEAGGNAILFADAIPFGKWLAYYYPNKELSGNPVNSKVIEPTGKGSLYENNRYNSPASGIPKDNFSAKYVTAKKIPAGEYIIKARADDGVRVYIDGKLVLDRWTGSAYREDAIKINIDDHPETGDTHWVEVRYFDKTNESRLYVAIEEFNLNTQLNADGWYAEYYPTKNLTGSPYVMGGYNTINSINSINYDWGYGSPHQNIPHYNFSAKFQRNQYFAAGSYTLNVSSDDGVRVYIDGKLELDNWTNGSKTFSKSITLTSGTHNIVVEHYEATGKAHLKFSLVKGSPYNTLDLRTKANITAQDIVDFFNKKSPNSHLKGLAQTFINVQNTYGVNAQYLVAHTILESGWNGSSLSQYKNNLYGYGAYDVCPFTCGYYFNPPEASINTVAYNVRYNYLTPGGKY
jgi:single-stranded DNA-binding protein